MLAVRPGAGARWPPRWARPEGLRQGLCRRPRPASPRPSSRHLTSGRADHREVPTRAAWRVEDAPAGAALGHHLGHEPFVSRAHGRIIAVVGRAELRVVTVLGNQPLLL